MALPLGRLRLATSPDLSTSPPLVKTKGIVEVADFAASAACRSRRLSELAREDARRMLAQVLIAEADSFVAMWKDLK